MNRSLRAALAILFTLCLLAFPRPSFSQATDWRQIQPPPLHPFHPPAPSRIQLANGMVIFLMEDHELPLIRGLARIHGASRDEPGDKAGLVEIFGQAWRTGGTKDKSGD